MPSARCDGGGDAPAFRDDAVAAAVVIIILVAGLTEILVTLVGGGIAVRKGRTLSGWVLVPWLLAFFMVVVALAATST
ncbi:hypothetical protein SAMN05421810_108135 [Amycolatopsis arida]|uniref:Uncharacterized protein n=2 Tax=Amycolatopsis arida TaxID=587909 RepID=A0A1I5Z1P1_9PSEU|nr:hypothetical protein CLV69_108135 [Amycolatopsis arida]SFQ50406.1 hypothetical protein SAMN05421810_108135 [Amycolatopsis arida]